MQYNNFQEALQTALNSEIEGWEKNNEVQFVRDLFDDRSIAALETNTEFLDCIPKDKYDDIVYELLTLLREYKNNLLTFNMEKFSRYAKKEHLPLSIKEFKELMKNEKYKSPITKIKAEIKALKQARETLLSIFPSRINKTRSISIKRCPTEFKATLMFLDNAIIDLERQEFKIIHRNRYYGGDAPEKTNLRNYINSLVKTYSIQSASMHTKQLIDAL
jgi:hypothetical protein